MFFYAYIYGNNNNRFATSAKENLGMDEAGRYLVKTMFNNERYQTYEPSTRDANGNIILDYNRNRECNSGLTFISSDLLGGENYRFLPSNETKKR